MFEIVDEPAVSAGRLNSDLNKISEWADKWLVTMNPVKSRNVVFSLKHNKQDHPPLFLDTKVVKDVECHTHIVKTKKASKRSNMLKYFKYRVDRSTLTYLYKRLIRPLMEYGDVIWS